MSKQKNKRPIYILDTNVLLYNPRALYAFPNADVVVPDIVLGELDKIKTSRADRELRYRSREISRILFELSENGKLTDGISFGKNSMLRVLSFDPGKGKPDMFGSKNSDDRILSIVYQLTQDNNGNNGRPVTVVTNDLNMLLKAQTLGIKVEHPGEEFAYSGFKRALFKVRQNRKTIMSTAAIALVILAIAYIQPIQAYLGINKTPDLQGPPDIVNALKASQARIDTIKAQIDTYEGLLKRNPKDQQALKGVGDSYFDMASITEKPKDYQKAIDAYQKLLEIDPKKNSVRTDMAVAYYYLGAKDVAKVELNKVIKNDPKFYQAYFNLGVIAFRGDNDLPTAKNYLDKTIALAPPTSGFAAQAQAYLNQINAQLQANSKGR